MDPKPRTLFEKIWDAHVVRAETPDTPAVLYVDLHLVHEVTSPQAFDGLRAANRKVRRPDLTIATEDHNVPTTGITGCCARAASGHVAEKAITLMNSRRLMSAQGSRHGN